MSEHSSERKAKEKVKSGQHGLERSRGREAAKPSQIPPRGWRDILLRTKEAIGNDHLAIVSAGVAFFLLLGMIPALAALLMIYGHFADPEDLREHFESAAHFLPPAAYNVFLNQMEELTGQDKGAGIGAILSLLFALWAGSRATKGLTKALNIAYVEHDDRGFIRKQLVSLTLTAAVIVMGTVALLLVAGLPAIIGFLPLTAMEETLVSWLRWPILLVMITLALAFLYRFGTSRRQPKWRWVSTGSIVVTVIWLLASAAFSVYVSNFGNFNETYGSLGAAVMILMWLYLTAFLILLGAEINAEMELQTGEDTTRGKPRPMGERGAYVADNIGKSH